MTSKIVLGDSGDSLPENFKSYIQEGSNSKGMELGLVVDMSYSMAHLTSEVLQGFNYLIDKQEGATISTLFFGTSLKMVYNGVDYWDVDPITESDYRPDGNTPLLDAIGTMINAVGFRYDSVIQKPKVCIAIQTDGYENDSRTFSVSMIAEMVRTRQAQGWEFIFMTPRSGRNFARQLGFKESNILDFSEDPDKFLKILGKTSDDIKRFGDSGTLRLTE